MLPAKLYNDPRHLDALWRNCLALLAARAPVDAASGV